MNRLLTSGCTAAAWAIMTVATLAQEALPEITGLEQILSEVPREALLAIRGGARQQESAGQAADVLRKKIEGRKATLTFKVEKVEKYHNRNDKADRYRVKAVDAQLRKSVTKLRGLLWIHLDPTQNAKTANIKKGDQLSVTGDVSLATIVAEPNPELRIDLSNGVIQ